MTDKTHLETCEGVNPPNQKLLRDHSYYCSNLKELIIICVMDTSKDMKIFLFCTFQTANSSGKNRALTFNLFCISDKQYSLKLATRYFNLGLVKYLILNRYKIPTTAVVRNHECRIAAV